jgi:hypothetical protein
MAGRGRSTSQKKQKEMARLEKRQQKAARKEVRKTEPKIEEDLENIPPGPYLEGDGTGPE